MRYIYLLFFVLWGTIALSAQVLVLVDGKAITTVDIQKRIEALKLASPAIVDDVSLRRQTLNNLISEELFHHEAKRLKISVSEEEIRAHFKGLQQDFHFTDDKLKTLMDNKSLWKQVESQLLWSKLVSAVFYSKVKVSDAEVQEEQKVRELEIKEVTFKQILFRSFDAEKIEKVKSEAKDCANLDEVLKANGLQKAYHNTLIFADLNFELQASIKSLLLNKLSETMDLGEQKQVIMVCNKAMVKNQQNNAHQIRQELGSRKINAEAQKYLSELKKRIYVEYVTPIE